VAPHLVTKTFLPGEKVGNHSVQGPNEYGTCPEMAEMRAFIVENHRRLWRLLGLGEFFIRQVRFRDEH